MAESLFSSMTHHGRRIGFAAALLLCATPAFGQQRANNGGGRALDANPQAGSGGTNKLENQVDYQARNNLITGNVAGGFRFQDNVGYGAPGAFRGNLGTDTLFRFRADSLGSAPAAVNIPRGNINAGGVTVYRDYTQPTFAPGSAGPVQPRLAPEGGVFRVYRDNFDANGTRITLDRPQPTQPRSEANTLGVVVQQDGTAQEVLADPLRGVRRSPLDTGRTDPLRPGQTAPDANNPYDAPRRGERGESEKDAAPRGFVDPGRFDPSQKRLVGPANNPELENSQRLRGTDTKVAPTLMLGQLTTNRAEASPQTIEDRVAKLQASIFGERETNVARRDPTQPKGNDAYDDLMEKIRAQARENVARDDQRREANRPDWMKSLEEPSEEQVDSAESQLNTVLERIRAARAQRQSAAQLGPDGQPLQDPATGTNADGTESANNSARGERAIDSLMEDLRYNVRLESLAGDREDRLAELFKQAEEQMIAGKFLNAERSYRQVRVEAPDNPLGISGLIHAQLGAGMIRSAAFNLRKLFEDHPELIATRYGQELLPPAERLGWLQGELQRMIDSDSSSLDPGIMLAYLGYQVESRQLVRYGLAVAEQAAPLDPLLPVLRGIWMDKPQSKNAPAPAPAPDSTK